VPHPIPIARRRRDGLLRSWRPRLRHELLDPRRLLSNDRITCLKRALDGFGTPLIPTATLESDAQNYSRRITILWSPATRETAFDVLINPCVWSVCFGSVAVGLYTVTASRLL